MFRLLGNPHRVGPWFAGKLALAPKVRDLAARLPSGWRPGRLFRRPQGGGDRVSPPRPRDQRVRRAPCKQADAPRGASPQRLQHRSNSEYDFWTCPTLINAGCDMLTKLLGPDWQTNLCARRRCRRGTSHQDAGTSPDAHTSQDDPSPKAPSASRTCASRHWDWTGRDAAPCSGLRSGRRSARPRCGRSVVELDTINGEPVHVQRALVGKGRGKPRK